LDDDEKLESMAKASPGPDDTSGRTTLEPEANATSEAETAADAVFDGQQLPTPPSSEPGTPSIPTELTPGSLDGTQTTNTSPKSQNNLAGASATVADEGGQGNGPGTACGSNVCVEGSVPQHKEKAASRAESESRNDGDVEQASETGASSKKTAGGENEGQEEPRTPADGDITMAESSSDQTAVEPSNQSNPLSTGTQIPNKPAGGCDKPDEPPIPNELGQPPIPHEPGQLLIPDQQPPIPNELAEPPVPHELCQPPIPNELAKSPIFDQLASNRAVDQNILATDIETLVPAENKPMRDGLTWVKSKRWGHDWDQCVHALIDFEQVHGFPVCACSFRIPHLAANDTFSATTAGCQRVDALRITGNG
jgi:hypothetical protein